MKKKSIKRRWPYFFGQRTPGSESGNMPELIKPDSGWRRTEDILRWADDGGKITDPADQTAGANPEDARKEDGKK